VLSFAGSLRVFLAVEPCDMRKRFEGLHGLVGERLREDVRGGALFVFTNRRHTRLKVLYFDGTGLWLMTKRLGLAADWLRPIYETIRTGVLGGGYVQVDEPSAAR
jgi:transposase